jgi:surface antigen
VGAGLGAMAGGYIGGELDKADRAAAERTCQQALESGISGKKVIWSNPDNGNSAIFIPQPAYETRQGYCREFQQTIIVGGRPQQGYGTACRQPDGSWQILGN